MMETVEMRPKVRVAKYPAYKDSGVEWLGHVPTEWTITRVKNVFKLIVDPAPKNNDFELLSVYTDIGVKPRRELEERGNKASTTDGYLHVKCGDIIVNKLLAWMGAIGISNYVGVTSPAYDILRAKGDVEPRFYHYLFRSEVCSSELKKHSRGIMDMRLRLYFDRFGDVLVPLPSSNIQRAIVTFLDKKTAQIDQAIAQKERQIELLKERRQILIHNAVTRGLNPNVTMKDSGVEWIGEIPEHWEVKRLKNVCEVNQEALPEDTPSSLSFEYVDIGSVTFEDGIFQTETCVFKTAPSRARRIAKEGDTVVSTVRTYLKAIDYIDKQRASYVYSTGFAVLHPVSILPEYLTFCIRSDSFTNQVDVFSKGMSYPAINSTEIARLFIAVAPSKEQKDIVKYVSDSMSSIVRAVNLKQQEIEKLKEYKATLINAAVTGKIKV